MTLDNHSIWLADSERGLLRPFVEAQDAAFVEAVRRAHPELLPDEERQAAIEQVWPEVEMEEEPENEEPLDPFPAHWKVIVREVCAKHGLTVPQIIGTCRSRDIVAARHEAFWRLSRETKMSSTRIGYRMGGKDHTTVLHGIKMHKQRMAARQREAA